MREGKEIEKKQIHAEVRRHPAMRATTRTGFITVS
jgi:hypothetical protein